MSLKKAAQLIGYVPQNHAPVYDYSVRDFIVMGRAPHLGMLEKPSGKDYAIVDEVIRELGIEKLADKAYTQISGGERQQALIGRAIAQQPEIIMFDEPTNHLDYGNQLRMVHKIKNLSQKDYTVIMTTHMPDHAMMIGGKTAILGRDGTLKVGKTEEIITEKKLEETLSGKNPNCIYSGSWKKGLCGSGTMKIRRVAFYGKVGLGNQRLLLMYLHYWLCKGKRFCI